METSPSRSQDAVAKFWDSYLEVLINHGIKSTSTRWYVKRVEQYIAFYPEERLARHAPQHVTGFFTGLGRNSKLKDWQFRQAVDAIRILFCEFLRVDWCSGVDWRYWSEASKGIAKAYTLTRAVLPPLHV